MNPVSSKVTTGKNIGRSHHDKKSMIIQVARNMEKYSKVDKTARDFMRVTLIPLTMLGFFFKKKEVTSCDVNLREHT